MARGGASSANPSIDREPAVLEPSRAAEGSAHGMLPVAAKEQNGVVGRLDQDRGFASGPGKQLQFAAREPARRAMEIVDEGDHAPAGNPVAIVAMNVEKIAVVVGGDLDLNFSHRKALLAETPRHERHAAFDQLGDGKRRFRRPIEHRRLPVVFRAGRGRAGLELGLAVADDIQQSAAFLRSEKILDPAIWRLAVYRGRAGQSGPQRPPPRQKRNPAPNPERSLHGDLAGGECRAKTRFGRLQ